ncbi:MAG: hypothetical protein ACLSB9_05440 [Hydrogeniiclostridium mannosilyticum]
MRADAGCWPGKAPGVKGDVVQLAHHGQNGGKSVYEAAAPQACSGTPLWLWENDPGQGYNSGPENLEVRRWIIDELKVH